MLSKRYNKMVFLLFQPVHATSPCFCVSVNVSVSCILRLTVSRKRFKKKALNDGDLTF